LLLGASSSTASSMDTSACSSASCLTTASTNNWWKFRSVWFGVVTFCGRQNVACPLSSCLVSLSLELAPKLAASWASSA
jgi:hypothetical protein